MITLTEKCNELNIVEKNKNKNSNIDYSWITVNEKATRDTDYVKREYVVFPF